MAGRISPPSRGSGVRWGAPGSSFGGAAAGRHGRGGTRLIAGRRLSRTLALRGVLALLFGVSALLWPDVTVLALALLFGAYALVDGAGMIGGVLTREVVQERPRRAYLLAGFAGLLAGVMSLLWPQITVLVLVTLAGLWAVVTGALEVTAAVRLRRERTGEWLLAAAGIVSVGTGVLILLRPDVGALALATVLGVYALIAGAVLLAAAWRLCGKPLVVVEVG
jgi:uncharacterized membrane protein HdeD (DUF308 family)